MPGSTRPRRPWMPSWSAGPRPSSTWPRPARLRPASAASWPRRPGPPWPVPTRATDRQIAENRVGHAIAELASYRDQLPAEAANELSEAATRVLIARRFFNDAVRDTRTLRARRMPRLLHLAGRRELPQYFDIDDSSLFAHDAGVRPRTARQPIEHDNR